MYHLYVPVRWPQDITELFEFCGGVQIVERACVLSKRDASDMT